jgi:hypothetical protein
MSLPLEDGCYSDIHEIASTSLHRDPATGHYTVPPESTPYLHTLWCPVLKTRFRTTHCHAQVDLSLEMFQLKSLLSQLPRVLNPSSSNHRINVIRRRPQHKYLLPFLCFAKWAWNRRGTASSIIIFIIANFRFNPSRVKHIISLYIVFLARPWALYIEATPQKTQCRNMHPIILLSPIIWSFKFM